MAEQIQEITCPECKGAKNIDSFHNTGIDVEGHHYGPSPCTRCKGTGQVPQAMLEWIKSGQLLKAARVERGESILEAALRMKVSFSTISKVELGKQPASDFPNYTDKP